MRGHTGAVDVEYLSRVHPSLGLIFILEKQMWAGGTLFSSQPSFYRFGD